jgi:hypothetical protein
MEFDQLQLKEMERLNKALKEKTIQPEDRKKMLQKKFNPQTGELQLFVDNGKGGIKMASVNIFE